VLEFPFPDSSFFASFLLKYLLCFWLFFANETIHQETQDVKFNCSCTPGFTGCNCLLSFFKFKCWLYFRTSRLQLSCTNVLFQLLAAIQDYLGYNCLLPIFKFNCNCTSNYSGYNCLPLFFKYNYNGTS
jgi:hypothetical protein